MAAACSHISANVLAHSESRVPSHSQDSSAVSSPTLHTNTTIHSQPTEPLLRLTTPQGGRYYDVSSHRPINSLGPRRWSRSHVMTHHSAAIASEKGLSNPLQRVKLLRWIKSTLAILMALWSAFCTIRYLLAFCIYGSITGQALSLTLGAITGLSFALRCCATILGFVQPHLVIHGFPVPSLRAMRSVLEYSASCCLLAPSIANLIVLFVWKSTTDVELQTRHRCRLDIDLVWSAPFSLCNHKSRTWGVWLALSAIRVVVTLVIIITFHFIASSSQFIPVRRKKSRQYRHKKGHNRLESYRTPLMPGNDYSKTSVLGRNSSLPPQSSDSTASTKTSPRNRLRANRSQLSALSEDDIQTEAPNYSNHDFLPMNGNRVEPEGESNTFVHRFRSLIAQITQETEEGIAFAHSDDSRSSHHAVDSLPSNESPELGTQEDYDNEDGFYTSSAIQTHGSYEQPQQYPAEEEIRILNGFVTRMPTIESMGSHELQSSMGASSTNRDRERIGALSKPPPCNALVSWASADFSGTGEPHSRRSVLIAHAEVLAGIYHSTEIGELIKRGDTIRKVDSPSMNADNSRSLGATTNSSSVLSYLTAPEIVTKIVVPSSDSDAPSYVPSPDHPNLKENSSRPQDDVNS